MPRRRTTLSVCTQHGCPTLTHDSRCPEHQLTNYNTVTHRTTRAAWQPHVDAGAVQCSRCGDPITPGEPWHLDHTEDRATYHGPAHAACNSGAHT